ncbi:glutathione S-transferase 3, mitochondrial-like isoform X1 [Haemaphysalis longicornis]
MQPRQLCDDSPAQSCAVPVLRTQWRRSPAFALKCCDERLASPPRDLRRSRDRLAHSSPTPKILLADFVNLPTMYSDSNIVFNCIQRSHQHFLEYYPQTLMILLLSGFEYPKVAAGAGVVYLAGRIVYAIGYSTGDLNKRWFGAFMYCGLFTLLGLSSHLGLRMLGYL